MTSTQVPHSNNPSFLVEVKVISSTLGTQYGHPLRRAYRNRWWFDPVVRNIGSLLIVLGPLPFVLFVTARHYFPAVQALTWAYPIGAAVAFVTPALLGPLFGLGMNLGPRFQTMVRSLSEWVEVPVPELLGMTQEELETKARESLRLIGVELKLVHALHPDFPLHRDIECARARFRSYYRWFQELGLIRSDEKWVSFFR